jgi:hypothetical protein
VGARLLRSPLPWDPWLPISELTSSRLARRSERRAVDAAAASSRSGHLGIRHRTSGRLGYWLGSTPLAASEILHPMCWIGSQPQRAVRHRLYDSAGSARCWHSSTARPRLKLRVRIHSAVVGESSEDSHAAAIRELDAHNWGALSATTDKIHVVGARLLRSPLPWDPWLPISELTSSRFARRSETPCGRRCRCFLSLGASGNSSSHLWAVTSLAGFGAADRQRKSLSPVCWVGSQPQRAFRHRLYDSAGSSRCWHSSTARPLLKLRRENSLRCRRSEE